MYENEISLYLNYELFMVILDHSKDAGVHLVVKMSSILMSAAIRRPCVRSLWAIKPCTSAVLASKREGTVKRYVGF